MIYIIIEYPRAAELVGIWAGEERNVDFRTDLERAARCTLSFGALELRKYLKMLLPDETISVSEKPGDGVNLFLRCENQRAYCEDYRLTPVENGLVISGVCRVGALYGVYELLKLQGVRWNAPGSEGEYLPTPREKLILPEKERKYSPATKLGRGFEFGDRMEPSPALLLWMVRNRLNFAGYSQSTERYAHKLGLLLNVGGHIFESALDPERLSDTGIPLWEAHNDWYGTPKSGEKVRNRALATQACMSQPELMDHLASQLIDHINGEWSGADLINVWPFDTWGDVCNCEKCRRLGNATDQALHLLSEMRARIDRHVTHPVRLIMSAYEGTSSIEPPSKPVPENLIKAGDFVTFFPILRCYAHHMDDVSCSHNAIYERTLKGWLKTDIPVNIGEYYNVSKHEDLPLLFTSSMSHDIPYYIKGGAQGMTYMHLPNTNWGMRTLTQLVYAALAWNPDADAERVIGEYFATRYGDFGEDLRGIYALMEEASLYCANWRSWSVKSLLSRLQIWDGGVPTAPLISDDHFADGEAACENGRRSVALYTEALRRLEIVRKKAREKGTDVKIVSAVNPAELSALRAQSDVYSKRLSEDKRLLCYGIDTYELMTDVAEYYTALYRGKSDDAEEAWARIEAVSEKLDGYYVPLTYLGPEDGVTCHSALTRTQLGQTVERCRGRRK